jgi:hypothetical protein
LPGHATRLQFIVAVLRFLGTVLLLLLALAMIAAALRPVCVELTPAQLRQLHPRFENREDRDLFYLKVYQLHDSVPAECRTWISRQLAL